MVQQTPHVHRPWWVKVALWGLSSRSSAWLYVWLCVGLAAACVLYGFRDRRFSAGVLFVFGSLWYYLAMRWVDRHGGWT